MVRGTLTHSVLTYFKVGQTMIITKLRELNLEAIKNVEDWKIKAGRKFISRKMIINIFII